MAFLDALFPKSAQLRVVCADDHNSPAEINAAKDLAAYKSDTGRPSIEAVVKVLNDPNKGVSILGWLNPHYYDPIAVRVSSKTGSEEWAFVDGVDVLPDDKMWSSDFEKNELAKDVLEILNKHKSALFRVIQPTATQGHDLRPL